MNASRERVIALALFALVVGVSLVHAPHGPELGADDHGQYLLHARSLVEGRPYVDIGFIHTPYSTLVAPIAEPPGLPVLIAGVFEVAGQRAESARIILFVSFALVGFVTWGYFRTLTTTGTAALVAAWTLIALGRDHALDTMLADLPFMLALWLTCLVADGAPVQGRRRLAVLAIAGAAAFAFRMAALPLLPAAATALLLRDPEERKGFLWLGIAWGVAAWAVMFALPAASVLAHESVRTPAAVWQDVVLNARESLDGARRFLPLRVGGRAMNLGVHLAMLGITLLGVTTGLRDRHRRFAWMMAGWYVLMLVALPTRAARYVYPLYPLLALGFIEGTERLLGARAPLRRQAGALARGVAGACLAIGVGADALAPVPPTYERLADVTAMRASLRQEATGGRRLRVVGFSPRVMAWEDGYTTMAPFEAPADEMLGVLRAAGITHVVVGDPSGVALGAAGAERLARERPDAFREVSRSATFTVLELVSKGARP